jgi:uncharacterized BrkB/YihY/UPF0761 family membrane protein
MNMRKIGFWIGAVLSLLASLYAGVSVFFYVWLNAADPDRWPPERAAPWAYGSLAVAIVMLVLFVFCILKLARKMDQQE